MVERGVAETSIRDIAGKSGISVGLIYDHFKSKDDIVFEITKRTMAHIVSLVPADTDENVQADPLSAANQTVAAVASESSRLGFDLAAGLLLSLERALHGHRISPELRNFRVCLRRRFIEIARAGHAGRRIDVPELEKIADHYVESIIGRLVLEATARKIAAVA